MENQVNSGNQNTQQVGQNPINQPVPILEKPKMNYLVIGTVVLACFVIFGFGGYYLGKQSSNSQKFISEEQGQSLPTTSPQGNAVTNPTDTPVVTQNPKTGETANWKTYTSSKAGYSFKYPTEWPLVNVPISQGCTVCVENIDFTPKYNPNSGDSNIAVILVFKEDNIKTLDDYVNIHVKGDSSKVNLQYTTVGGEKAVSYKLSGGIPPLPVIEYAVVKNGMYYIIRLDDSVETNKNREKNLMLFNQILSTFTFSN